MSSPSRQEIVALMLHRINGALQGRDTLSFVRRPRYNMNWIRSAELQTRACVFIQVKSNGKSAVAEVGDYIRTVNKSIR